MIRALRHALTVVTTVTLTSAFGNSLALAQTHEVGHWLGIWSLAEFQSLKTCVSAHSPQPSSDDRPTEEVAFYFNKIMDQSGDVVFETELRVPLGEFRCVDIPYDDLSDDIEPDPTTGAVTFQYDLRGNVMGAVRPSGAIMIISSRTGKVELYERTGGDESYLIADDIRNPR